MSYEKHIEALEQIESDLFPHKLNAAENEALRAAIELMRAAQPKDEAAEREYCVSIAECARAADERFELVPWLVRERAAVRAECYVRQARSDETFEKAWSQMHYQYGEDALEQVRLGWEMAENRGLAANVALVRSAKELKAAQAEVADLRVCLDVAQHNHKTEERRADELETQLSNLRAAAERVLQGDVEEFSAAIEASK